jgi:hypothetical protein
MKNFFKKNTDQIGSTLSLVCLIHCLFLPILIATVPFVSFLSFMQSFWAEALMIIFAILNAILAVTSGFKQHKNYIVVSFFVSGALFLILSFIVHKYLHFADYFTPIGAFILGAGHFFNKRMCKTCSTCNTINE